MRSGLDFLTRKSHTLRGETLTKSLFYKAFALEEEFSILSTGTILLLGMQILNNHRDLERAAPAESRSLSCRTIKAAGPANQPPLAEPPPLPPEPPLPPPDPLPPDPPVF